MIRFAISPHLLRASAIVDVIEVWQNNQLVASIYGRENEAGHALISVVTKHEARTVEEETREPVPLHTATVRIIPRTTT